MDYALGTRMKENYEQRFRYFLSRRTYTIIRIDGKAFHTYTRGLIRPFDDGLIEDMDVTAKYLCKNVMNCKLGYVQSDEITLVLCDFETNQTDAWFDNNLQKMASVSASMATRAFNEARLKRLGVENMKWGEFDSRVFQIPQKQEVFNMLIWRQEDCTRNSIQSVAQSLFSQKELHGKNCNLLQELIFNKGINWNDYNAKYKRGRVIVKEFYEKETDSNNKLSEKAMRSRWISVAPPIFTEAKDFLDNILPNNF